MTERTKAAREWLGVETSEQLIRLRKQLGLSFDEMEVESELYERSEQVRKESKEALKELREFAKGIQENDSENQAVKDLIRLFNRTVSLIEKAKDLNIAALLSELTDALEKREND